jgi:hypothetical protein
MGNDATRIRVGQPGLDFDLWNTHVDVVIPCCSTVQFMAAVVRVVWTPDVVAHIWERHRLATGEVEEKREVRPVPTRKLPEFKSVREEAEFWDAHSPLDFPDEFEDVEDVKFVRPKKEVMAIRMDKATVDLLERIARRLGIQHTTLARAWLAERLEKEARSPTRGTKKSSTGSRKAA